MARSARRFANAVAAQSLFTPPAAVEAPSERVVSAVMAFADLSEEREDGLVVRRFSAARLRSRAMAEVLDAAERRRALDISVLWNAAEDEIVRVIDLAPLRAGREAFERRAERTSANAYAAARIRADGFAQAA